MAKIIGLPKLSPTMDEGTLVKWVKSEGDEIKIDDLLAEVETDKATMEFRSFDKGVLLKILVPEGETLAPDTPVAIIGTAGEDIAGLLGQVGSGPAAASPAKEAPAPAAPMKADVEEGQTRTAYAGPSAQTAHARPAEPANGRQESRNGATSNGDRVLASPLVRRLAREQDLDLASIEGTGPKGRVVKRDVEQHAQNGSSARRAPQATSPSRETRVEKASSMRKTIARRLTESKQNVPHFYLNIDVDAEPLWNARVKINEQLKDTGEKVSLNDMIIKAAAVALRRVPEVNASWMNGEIHYHGRVDISVAVAIPDGLITPVVRDADRKGVLEISREVHELAGRAKEKKLQPEEFTDGTFSISNLGMFGIEDFAAVINPPEGAILAVGAVREEPVVKNGSVVPGRRMRLTMSCDHRVVDGAVGAKWLSVLKGMLENPMAMLL